MLSENIFNYKYLNCPFSVSIQYRYLHMDTHP